MSTFDCVQVMTYMTKPSLKQSYDGQPFFQMMVCHETSQVFDPEP